MVLLPPQKLMRLYPPPPMVLQPKAEVDIQFFLPPPIVILAPLAEILFSSPPAIVEYNIQFPFIFWKPTRLQRPPPIVLQAAPA